MEIHRWHVIDVHFNECERAKAEALFKQLTNQGWELNQEDDSILAPYSLQAQFHRLDLPYKIGEPGEKRRGKSREITKQEQLFLKEKRQNNE
jgi:hypothetical protein